MKNSEEILKECEKKVEKAKTRAERRREEREQKEQDKRKQQKIKDAIKMINDVVKLELGASAGKVVVSALRNIKKGEKLYATAIPCLVDIPYEDFEKIRPEIREKILLHFPQVITGSHFMCPDVLMQMFIRHDEKSNYDALNDKALRDIFEGEEITQDYRKIENWEKIKLVNNVFDFIK